jgi:hypothetical protein
VPGNETPSADATKGLPGRDGTTNFTNGGRSWAKSDRDGVMDLAGRSLSYAARPAAY